MTTYQEAWQFLDQLQFFKIKLGLESIREFLGRLGNPQEQLSCIHIGGTNGKGSVGATLHSILAASGRTTGFYTSPHLSNVRERFRINGRFMSEAEFASLGGRIMEVLDGGQITYFEFTTALALLWFAESKVDLAILEVGMGGRLDATNVISPLISLITNVSMDHEQYLGSTLRQIAWEKAGIIKPGVTVISAVRGEACQVIKERCRELASPLRLLDRDFFAYRKKPNSLDFAMEDWDLTGLSLSLKGKHQMENAALALACLHELALSPALTHTQLRAGLAGTVWPGRLEEFWLNSNKEVLRRAPANPQGWTHYLLDGAHNPAGIDTLIATLNESFAGNRLILVWAAMEDKDSSKLPALVALVWRVIFTRPLSERAATPEHLLSLVPEHLRARCKGSESVAEALDLARSMSLPGDLLCVAGSLYLVGRARQLLLGELVDA